MSKPRDVNRIVIEKILYYCDQIDEALNRFGKSFETYVDNKLFRHSCDMCIIQIGELTTRLTHEFKAEHPEIFWHKIKATRNVYVHDYENVDLSRAWENLTDNIPELKAQLEQILAAEAASNEN